MSAWSARQLAAVGSIVFVVVIVIAFLLPGDAPSFDADGVVIADFFADKHDRILVTTVLVGFALLVFVGVIAGLCRALADAGFRELWIAVALGGAATVAVMAFSVGSFGGLAQVAGTGGGDTGAIRAFYQTSSIVSSFLGWTWLAIVIPVAIAAWRGALERWAAWTSALIAVFLVLYGLSVQASGAFAANTGFFCRAGFIAFLAFMVQLALLLWRPERPALPRTTTRMD